PARRHHPGRSAAAAAGARAEGRISGRDVPTRPTLTTRARGSGFSRELLAPLASSCRCGPSTWLRLPPGSDGEQKKPDRFRPGFSRCGRERSRRRLPAQSRADEPLGIAVGELHVAAQPPVLAELPLRAKAPVEVAVVFEQAVAVVAFI